MKIVGILLCLLVLTTCLPVTGITIDSKNLRKDITPFWNPEHIVSVHISHLYVYESGDSGTNEPGEYYFSIFVFPAFYHVKSLSE